MINSFVSGSFLVGTCKHRSFVCAPDFASRAAAYCFQTSCHCTTDTGVLYVSEEALTHYREALRDEFLFDNSSRSRIYPTDIGSVDPHNRIRENNSRANSTKGLKIRFKRSRIPALVKVMTTSNGCCMQLSICVLHRL